MTNDICNSIDNLAELDAIDNEAVFTDEPALDKHFDISEHEFNNAMNMAKAMAFHLRNSGWQQFTVQELVDAGVAGIAEAAVRFDPTKGTVKLTKFTTYAYFWIRKMQQEYIAKNKSMLSGKLAECYAGLVPYTISIDAMTYDNDKSMHDHCMSLSSDVDIYQDIVDSETSRQRRDLLSTMLAKLPELERTAYLLSNGIGTVTGECMTVRQIAASMRISIGYVSALVNRAKHMLQCMTEEFQQRYSSINRC